MGKRRAIHVAPMGDRWATHPSAGGYVNRLIDAKGVTIKIDWEVTWGQEAELIIHGRGVKFQNVDSCSHCPMRHTTISPANGKYLHRTERP